MSDGQLSLFDTPAPRATPKVCGECGEQYWNTGAHAERCTGRPTSIASVNRGDGRIGTDPVRPGTESDGDGHRDGGVKPRSQLAELPGDTFEDMFGGSDEPPQDRIRLSPDRPQMGRFHHDGHDTEVAAAAAVVPRSGTQRAAVLAALQAAKDDGVTDYELWHLHQIGARPHVPATRREELIADGWPIKDSGLRRYTDTGSPAIVWVLA